MKRNTAAWATLLGLAIAVTGCVQLDTELAVPSATPDSVIQGPVIEVPVEESIPAPVIPEIPPYSAAGLNQRIKSLAKDSEARELQAGKHPIDNAVPGSEKVLIAEIISGESYVALPKIDGGRTLRVSLRCQEETRFDVGVYGLPDGTHIGGGNGECGPLGGTGFGFGWSPHRISGYLHFIPSGDEKVEITVIDYESAESPFT
jgi:hypothetical protein